MKKKLSLTVKIRQYFKIEFLTELSAALMVALGIKVFSAPNLIVGGGVSGIASVLYVLFGLPIGIVSLALNLPLLFIGWRELGNRFTFRTLRVVAVISIVTDIVLKDMPAGVYKTEFDAVTNEMTNTLDGVFASDEIV